MAVTLKASKQGRRIVDEARKRKGWSALSDMWVRTAYVTESTLKRFREMKAIQREAFISICKAVGVDDWEEIAEIQLSNKFDNDRLLENEDSVQDVSLHEEFLVEFLDKLYPFPSSPIHQDCFLLRFHPQNWSYDNTQIIAVADEAIRESFHLNSFDRVLSEVLDRIKITFADEIATAELDRSENLFEYLYKWLWVTKFPIEAFQLGKRVAAFADRQILMKSYSASNDRDLDFDDLEICLETINVGKQYLIEINLPQKDGYLLLLNEGHSGQIYCLCPSLLYTRNQDLSATGIISLPQNNAPVKAFKYKDVGEEFFLAIVIKSPLRLSWIRSDYSPTDAVDYVKVDADRLQEIFQQIGKQADSQVFGKKFKVINS
jgi:hypothetical protein